jgi:hypothetical protein
MFDGEGSFFRMQVSFLLDFLVSLMDFKQESNKIGPSLNEYNSKMFCL